MKRSTLVLLLVLIVLLAGAAVWFLWPEKPVEVTAASVQRETVRATVANTRAGTVNTCNRARMSPILGGQIAALPVSEGDKVSAGQMLLELWNDDIRAQLLLVEKELETAKARADESCSAAAVVNREAERIERLYKQQLVSEEQADSVIGESKAREAGCRAMRSMVEVSEAGVQLREAQLEKTILRAPFDGTVAEINGEVGEIVTPSPVGVATLPAVDLIDSSCTFVTAPIDEVDAPGIQEGMKAEITMDAFPDQSFPATIRRIAPYVTELEKQARTVDIEAVFDQSSPQLLPGYSADIEVLIEAHENVLSIPTQAILDNEKVLLINDSGVLEERAVKLGIRNWQISEIVSGLAENDQVVLSLEREGVRSGVSVVVDDGDRSDP